MARILRSKEKECAEDEASAVNDLQRDRAGGARNAYRYALGLLGEEGK